MKKIFVIMCIPLIALFLTESETANSAELVAGTAKVDITAPLGYPMGGYGARKEGAKAVHDPLFARVLLLKDGQVSLALISLDLVFFSSDRIISEARKRWGIDHVILASTHTHAGPIPKTGGLLELAEFKKDPADLVDFAAFSRDPWFAATEDKIIAAIGDAERNLFPARIGAGKGSIYLGHNRRLVKDDGSITMLWKNPERIPTNPVDPTVGVVRVDDESGNPRALLVNYACHAVVLGSDNLSFSADYPGAMVAHIEEEFGAQCMGMFFQGASGDIDPYDCVEPGTERGFQLVHETGAALGKEAIRAAKNINTRLGGNSSIRVKQCVLTVPHRYDPAKKSDVSMMTVVINERIALAAIPGEPFVQHQIDLMRRSHLDYTFLISLSYCGGGIPLALYLPTLNAAVEGGYGADNTTFLEVGTGERLIDTAIISIYELLDMLSDVPAGMR